MTLNNKCLQQQEFTWDTPINGLMFKGMFTAMLVIAGRKTNLILCQAAEKRLKILSLEDCDSLNGCAFIPV